MKFDDRGKFRMLSLAMAVGLSAATRLALRRGWKMGTDEDPPNNPAEPGVSWLSAILWGAVTGATAGVARTVARRLASEIRDA